MVASYRAEGEVAGFIWVQWTAASFACAVADGPTNPMTIATPAVVTAATGARPERPSVSADSTTRPPSLAGRNWLWSGERTVSRLEPFVAPSPSIERRCAAETVR